MSPNRELILVMPVYNEAECIARVLNDWRAQLDALAIDFEILALNDGSKDDTAQVLAAFDDDARISVINKANSGHGPTILKGYREAAARANWVFQCDSDDEMKPDDFSRLWEKREKYDALMGIRAHREQSGGRKFLSGGSRIVIKLLFGRGVRDVNVPYRLMRSSVLAPMLQKIPDDTFAPNLLISGMLARGKFRLLNLPVPHENRKTGEVSLRSWKVYSVALRSLRQTLIFLARQKLGLG